MTLVCGSYCHGWCYIQCPFSDLFGRKNKALESPCITMERYHVNEKSGIEVLNSPRIHSIRDLGYCNDLGWQDKILASDP